MRPDGPPGVWVRDQNWQIVLVVLIVLALCAGGFAAGVFHLLSVAEPAGPRRQDPSREAVVTFAGHVRSGAVEPAYALLCAPARSEFDLAAFAAFVAGRKPAESVKVSGVLTRGPESTPDVAKTYAVWTVYNVWFEFTDGDNEVRHIPVVKEPGGEHRVCGHPF